MSENSKLKIEAEKEAKRIESQKSTGELSLVEAATLTLAKSYIQIEDIPDFEDENGIFNSQIKFAYDIFHAFLENDIVIAKAPMQFGKTGSMFFLANELLRFIMHSKENVVFMTSMSDTALFIQNQESLSKKRYITKGNKIRSNIVVKKMFPDFKKNAEKYIKEFNIKYLIFDECDYGSGNKSLFNKTFFNRLKKENFPIKVLLVSATPYCALNAVFNKELDAAIVDADIPDNYFGVSEMLRLDMITDLHDIYGDGSNEPYNIISRGKDKSINLSEEFTSDLNWFMKQEGGGISIIRAKNDVEAKLIKSLSVSHFKNQMDIISDSDDSEDLDDLDDSDFSAISVGVNSIPIKEVLGDGGQFLYNKVVNNEKKVLLIVINALTAGKDLGDLKDYVRLVVESRSRAVANGSQGLVGRLCGYHKNRNLRIIASKKVLSLYSKMEINAEVMCDNDFIDEAVELKLDFSTQLKKGKKSVKKLVYEQNVHDVFSYEDYFNSDSRLKSLFDDESFGTFEELGHILKGQMSKGLSAINTQRKSKYKKNPLTFDEIWNECENKTISFGNRFHRFRAEGNNKSRLRIKRGLIIDDESKLFFIIDRLDDGKEEVTHATINNKSCYLNS